MIVCVFIVERSLSAGVAVGARVAFFPAFAGAFRCCKKVGFAHKGYASHVSEAEQRPEREGGGGERETD